MIHKKSFIFENWISVSVIPTTKILFKWMSLRPSIQKDAISTSHCLVWLSSISSMLFALLHRLVMTVWVSSWNYYIRPRWKLKSRRRFYQPCTPGNHLFNEPSKTAPVHHHWHRLLTQQLLHKRHHNQRSRIPPNPGNLILLPQTREAVLFLIISSISGIITRLHCLQITSRFCELLQIAATILIILMW